MDHAGSARELLGVLGVDSGDPSMDSGSEDDLNAAFGLTEEDLKPAALDLCCADVQQLKEQLFS